jgi:hypothetical protein
MYCPQCGAEYRPGFTRCADCEVPLVAGKPPAPPPPSPEPLSLEPLALTTVFSTGSIALMAVAKVVLNTAGLPFVTKGEGLAELVGGLRFNGAPSLITGPMQIQVRGIDADEARALLEEVRETEAGQP